MHFTGCMVLDYDNKQGRCFSRKFKFGPIKKEQNTDILFETQPNILKNFNILFIYCSLK